MKTGRSWTPQLDMWMKEERSSCILARKTQVVHSEGWLDTLTEDIAFHRSCLGFVAEGLGLEGHIVEKVEYWCQASILWEEEEEEEEVGVRSIEEVVGSVLQKKLHAPSSFEVL
jgi:hypothetical protein